MLMDRITKETTDISRVVMDMSPWLDPGETITTVVSQKIMQGTTGWSEAPYPPPGSIYPYDATPLTQTVSLDGTRTQVIAFVSVGSPGLVYTCQYVLLGTSGRQVTIELGVQINGIPIGAPGYGPIPSYLAVTISDLPPENPQCGQLWWDSSSPELYIYYCDPSSSEWVIVTGNYGAIASDAPLDGRIYGRQAASWVNITPPSGLYLPLAGGIMQGPITLAGNATLPLHAVPLQQLHTAIPGGPVVWSADTPPPLVPGALWWDSVGTNLYVAYNDGTSTQWVAAYNQYSPPVVWVSDTPPPLVSGTLWWDSVGTQLYLAYHDGTSLQWVVVENQNTLVGSWTSNGNTAVSLTALAPAGAHATVQEWLTITDPNGNVRYIPCF
jgi:hypothetical protein